MEDKRDFIDELIAFQEEWQSAKEMPEKLLTSFLGDDEEHAFNPEDYQEIPYANSSRCLSCALHDPQVCTRCTDICPASAIEVQPLSVLIDNETCIGCGLCTQVCPVEAFGTRRHTPRQIHEEVVRVASAYEACYVTCPRALGRHPHDNEVVLPCIGQLSRELWFAILSEYTNVHVYLPVGICDDCPVHTGEDVYGNAISEAETWACTALDLIADESELTHDFTRAYKRSQFMSSIAHSAELFVMRGNVVLAGAKAIAQKVVEQSRKLDRLQLELEETVGSRTSSNKTRILTQSQKLLLGALQRAPQFAPYVERDVPVIDPSRCSMCGDCASVCTPRALDLDAHGNITIAPHYCVSCAACVDVCLDKALTMEPLDAHEIVLPDREAERAAAQAARMKQQTQEFLSQVPDRLDALGDALMRLEDFDTDI